jgi:hypothetical protein
VPLEHASPLHAERRGDDALRRLIREHEVCFELLPHYEVNEGAKVQVGFDLTLYGRRSRLCHADPGCPECFKVYEGLKEVALSAMPPDARYEVGPFDASFHLRPENHFEPQVMLVVEILHGETFEAVDETERKQANAISEALTLLGAQQRVWVHR